MVNDLNLFVHQRKLIKWPYDYPSLEFIFLIGGYACGKSLADVASIFSIVKRYNGYPVVCAICSTTITLYRKTIWLDLVKWLVMCNIPYRYDKQENVLQIGTVKFLIIPTEQPELIYGPNVSISIFDEIDELPQDKALLAFEAISERTRIPLPDGRKPYMLFTTTAQGLKGVYQITEELREKNMNFAIIRGLTKDNTSLDPAYYQRLWDLYDENERRAYLCGEFVNLSSGRVYPGFDDSKGCIIDDIQPEELDTIHVGQDLNTGFSKATAWIKRNNALICVKDFSFKEIGMAPQILRTAFPTQRILWYPDASSKEIMKGYTDEIRAQDIEVRWGSVNPSIVDRIFLINKGFQTKRLFVNRSCKDLIMGLKTRQYDDKGNPEKGAGEKSPDH